MTGLRYQVDSTDIASSGGISLKSSVATLAGITLGLYTPFFSFSETPKVNYKLEDRASVFAEIKDWELKLKGSESSGSISISNEDGQNVLAINSFALTLINSQTSVPSEFEMTFKKKFWDILA